MDELLLNSYRWRNSCRTSTTEDGPPEGSAVVMLCTEVHKPLWRESEVTCTLSHRAFVLEQMVLFFATVATHLAF